MVASVKGKSVFYSAQPDRLQEVANAVLTATSVPGGGVVPNSSVNFVMSATDATKIVSEAQKLGLKAYVLGAAFTVSQDKVIPAVAGAIDIRQPLIARLGQWKLVSKVPGESKAFMQDTGELNGVGMLAQYAVERINPACALRMVEDCPMYRNGMAKHMSANAVGAGSVQCFGDKSLSEGQDSFEGFGAQQWQMQLVSTAAGATIPNNESAHKADIIPFPFCRSAGDTGRSGVDSVGEGVPLELLVKSSNSWEFRVTRIDATGLYPVGTTFGDATVRVFLMIRLYRMNDLGGGNDKRAIGPMWYMYEDSTNLAPYTIPQHLPILHIAVPPSYRSTETFVFDGAAGTLQAGFAPVNYAPALTAGAEIRWIEKRNGVDMQVFPLLSNDQHPEHIIYDMHNCGSRSWRAANDRYGRTALQMPDIKRGEAPWTAAASTRIHPLVAGCVTPTQLGCANTQLQETGSILSRLWELPLAVVYPAAKGMPGGPVNTGDIGSCSARIESKTLGTVFASARSIIVLCDAGMPNANVPGGFENSAVRLSRDGCECVAESGAVLAIDDSSKPGAEAFASTGYVTSFVPGTGTP